MGDLRRLEDPDGVAEGVADALSALRGHLDSQRVRLVGGKLSPQLTAFFTSAPILASSAAVN